MDQIKELYKKIVRPSGRWTDQLILNGVIGFTLITLGQILGLGISRVVKPFFSLFSSSESVVTFLSEYFSFIGIWIVILLVMVIFKKNRPMLKTVKMHKDHNNFKSIFLGLLIGFAMNAFCILMSVILGDIQLSFAEINLPLFLLFLISVFIQSGAEEFTSRGYLHQKLRRRYHNPLVAIIGGSSYFVIFHLFNPGVTFFGLAQIFVIAVLFAMFVYYYDDLYLAMGVHAGWNFTQSILFGLPNSGIVSEYSVFRLEGAIARNGLFYDVHFGVEGSVGGVILCILVCGVVYYLNRGKKEHTDYWVELNEELTKAKETTTEEQ